MSGIFPERSNARWGMPDGRRVLTGSAYRYAPMSVRLIRSLSRTAAVLK